MTELLTAAQMRACERAAMEAGEVTGLELMERAGRGTVEAILDWRPELAEGAHRAVVLCGPGNNGGDGFVVARLLHARGWEVAVYLYGRAPEEIDRLAPDAATNARRWAMLGEIEALSSEAGTDRVSSIHDRLNGADLVVDALFGTGLTRPLPWLEPITTLRRDVFDDGFWSTGEVLKPYVVAVDLPSGLCSDSGRNLVPAESSMSHRFGNHEPQAHLTVTYHRPKLGHVLAEGPMRCLALRVVDIGLNGSAAIARMQEIVAYQMNGEIPPAEAIALRPITETPWPLEGVATRDLGKSLFKPHKYHHGHALILAGGVGRGGAARLAARGALRIGAGLVTVGCPPAALIENAARLDAIMLRPVGGPEALAALLEDKRINALCLGPGLGVGEATKALVETACRAGRNVVLDADALTSFADDPQALFDLLRGDDVLTPHEGEFGKLFPDILEKLKARPEKGPAYSKVDATREAERRAGCTVLFKGADTVIAFSNFPTLVHSASYERAAPWLATAGSGDVLAGLITGLLARGLGGREAAGTAAWLHVEAARRFGPGLIAEDLPEQLPVVMADLGL